MSSGELEMEPEEDQTGICWTDPHYCERFNAPYLHEKNIIHYFSFSPFYDRTCINSQLHQQQFTEQQQQEALLTCKGKQYMLDGAQPPYLWVLIRSVRLTINDSKTTGMFYIIDRNVFQSPTMLNVIQSRLVSSVFHVHSAFNILSTFTEYDPIHNYAWNRKKSDKTVAVDPVEDQKNWGTADKEHMDHLMIGFHKRIMSKPVKRQAQDPVEQPLTKKQRKT